MASESVVCKERRRGRWRRRAFSRELSGFSDAEKRDRERIDRLVRAIGSRSFACKHFATILKFARLQIATR
jgi:hypothetical protein